MEGDVSMELAKVTSKGQITIPVSIRRRLGIKEGDKLLFIDSQEGVIMVNPDMLQGGQVGEARREAENTPRRVAPPLFDALGSGRKDNERIDVQHDADMDLQATDSDAAASVDGLAIESMMDPDESDPHDTQPPAAGGAAEVAQAVETPPEKVKTFDWDSLIDEIRSIGSKL